MAEDQLRGHINMQTSAQIPSGTTQKHNTVSFTVITFFLFFQLKQFIHPQAQAAVVFWVGCTTWGKKRKKLCLFHQSRRKLKEKQRQTGENSTLTHKIQHLENNENETVQVHGVFSQQSSAVFSCVG